MRWSLILFFLVLAGPLLGQETTKITEGKIVIPLKKELNLKAELKGDKIVGFEIVEDTSLIEPSEFMMSLDQKPKEFEDIYINFNESDFGILLTLVHRFERPIIYKARIKIRGRKNPVETSIQPSYPGVFSVEQWRDEIEEIELYDFEYFNE
ncbi:MAG: hypothetical protein AAGD88_06255 [Bacteroidota bacterium]